MYAKCALAVNGKSICPASYSMNKPMQQQRIPCRGGNSQGYLGVSMFMHVFLTIDISMYLNVNRLTKYSAYLCDSVRKRGGIVVYICSACAVYTLNAA